MLDAGTIAARLDLDDPSKVQQAKPYTGTLPVTHHPSRTHGERIHQVFQSTRCELENILGGYSLPEPYSKNRMVNSVGILMKCLKNPMLPLLELMVSNLCFCQYMYLHVDIFVLFCQFELDLCYKCQILHGNLKWDSILDYYIISTW